MRVIKRNTDLSVYPVKPSTTEEYFDLYKRYINIRHKDGDMYPACLLYTSDAADE